MASITSAQTGLFSATSTWVGGVVPVLGDKVTIATGHVVTVDGTYNVGDDTSTAININGTLKASRTVNSSITGRGDFVLGIGGTLDYGTEADPIPSSVTAVMIVNDSATMGQQKWGFRTLTTGDWAGFRAWGADKTGRTNMAAATSTDTVIVVDDATGWQVGDYLMFGGSVAQGVVRSQVFRSIVSISGTSITISGNLGFASQAQRDVVNLTRNVKFTSKTPETYRSQYSITARNTFAITGAVEIGPSEWFCCGGGSGTGTGGALNFTANAFPTLTTAFVKKIYRPVFHTIASISGSTVVYIAPGAGLTSNLTFTGTNGVLITIDGMIATATFTSNQYSIILQQNSNLILNNCVGIGGGRLLQASTFGTNSAIINNAYISGLVDGPWQGVNGKIQFNNSIFNGIFQPLSNGASDGYTEFNNCNFNGALGLYGTSTGTFGFASGALYNVTFNNCIFPQEPFVNRTGTNINLIIDGSSIYSKNWNNSTLNQRVFSRGGTYYRDNTNFNRGTSSIALSPWYAGIPITYSTKIAVSAGETITLVGYLRYNTSYGSLTLPNITVSGLGITPQSFTASVPDTWQKFSFTITNPQSYSGEYDITFVGQSATNSTTPICWLDGFILTNFIEKVRHYGYVFDNQLKQTADVFITQATESTVAAYTGISINHTTQTITISSNHTIQELYDYCKYNLCQTANLGYSDFFTTTDGTNFVLKYNLIINNATLSGTNKFINMSTKTLTLSGTGKIVPITTDINGTTGIVTITNLNGHSIIVFNTAGTETYYNANVTGSYSFDIPIGSVGTWKAVVKKAGYTHQTLNIPSIGGLQSFIVTTPQKLSPDGTVMYQGTSSSFLDIVFNGTTQANIDIGNSSIYLQAVLDESEDALCTEAGLQWLASGKSDLSIFNSGGGDYLFLTDNWRLRRRSSSDVNATIQAFVTSSQGMIVDGVNGGVQFLVSDSPTAIAAAVRTNLAIELSRIDANISSRSTLTAPNVRTELATELGRIDTTISSRSTLTAPNVRTELATELGRIDTTISSRSTLNAAGVRTELSPELARIDVAVSTRSTLTAAAVRTELAVELSRLDVAVSSRSTLTVSNVQALTDPISAKVDIVSGQITALSIPTTGQIRTELAPELARIDTTISSRLATSSYTAPDNATIGSINTRVNQLPTLSQIEASTILAKKTDVQITVQGGFTTTDRDTLNKTKTAASNAFAIGASK